MMLLLVVLPDRVMPFQPSAVSWPPARIPYSQPVTSQPVTEIAGSCPLPSA